MIKVKGNKFNIHKKERYAFYDLTLEYEFDDIKKVNQDEFACLCVKSSLVGVGLMSLSLQEAKALRNHLDKMIDDYLK